MLPAGPCYGPVNPPLDEVRLNRLKRLGVNHPARIEAERWYRRAVEQGNASAQYNLGVKYYNSLPQDHAEAAKWFRKAAKGNADAQYNLGVIYDKGYGVPQDYVQAHKWYKGSPSGPIEAALAHSGLQPLLSA